MGDEESQGETSRSDAPPRVDLRVRQSGWREPPIKNPAVPAGQGRDAVTGNVSVGGQRPCGIREVQNAKANRNVEDRSNIAAMRLMESDS
jgi:hypothetical protein